MTIPCDGPPSVLSLELGSEAEATKEYERLIAEKRREKFVEVKVAAAQPVDRAPMVTGLLKELRDLGARIETKPNPDAESAFAAAEKTLGFALPNEYRAFITRFGQIEIAYGDRTTFFYGLPAALAKTREYQGELDSWREKDWREKDPAAAYHPSRFVVLNDEGDHSNIASGNVYDDGLKAIVTTSGGEPVDTNIDARAVDYWTFLVP